MHKTQINSRIDFKKTYIELPGVVSHFKMSCAAMPGFLFIGESGGIRRNPESYCGRNSEATMSRGLKTRVKVPFVL